MEKIFSTSPGDWLGLKQVKPCNTDSFVLILPMVPIRKAIIVRNHFSARIFNTVPESPQAGFVSRFVSFGGKGFYLFL